MKNQVRTTLMSLLNPGPASENTLASRLGMPGASVRRLIGELRKSGTRVVSTYYGYRLAEQPTATPATQQATA